MGGRPAQGPRDDVGHYMEKMNAILVAMPEGPERDAFSKQFTETLCSATERLGRLIDEVRG